jgi:hypothetical protein
MKKNYLPVNAPYFSFLRDHKNKLDMIDFVIYTMLLSRADAKTAVCFPSIKTISRDCFNMDRRTIWKHLQRLADMELIAVVRARGKPNKYFMSDFKRWTESQDKDQENQVQPMYLLKS